jgi:hypothetical protein
MAEMKPTFAGDIEVPKKDILKAFILLNDAGKAVDHQVIDNAKVLLEKEVKNISV